MARWSLVTARSQSWHEFGPERATLHLQLSLTSGLAHRCRQICSIQNGKFPMALSRHNHASGAQKKDPDPAISTG